MPDLSSHSVCADTVLASAFSATADLFRQPARTAIVSSRLGRPVERYEDWFAKLELQVFRAREQNAPLILVEGTTTYPWIKQAADLYRTPTQLIEPATGEDRDALAIGAADRVIALHIRPQGKIFRLLKERLEGDRGGANVWVSIDGKISSEIQGLMDLGAVGWYWRAPSSHHSSRPREGGGSCETLPAGESFQWGSNESPVASASLCEVAESSDWLVHCTRGRSGPMPGQTLESWGREVLLRGASGQPWSAAEVLEAIVRSRLLRGNPLIKGGESVVCFSEVPLNELLQRRTFRSHRGRWDYEPFGIAIRKRAIEAAGAMPVEYREGAELRKLRQGEREEEGELWRMQPYGKTYDWREEREWRIRGSVDLDRFSDEDVFIFSADGGSASRLQQIAPWPIVMVDPSRSAKPN